MLTLEELKEMKPYETIKIGLASVPDYWEAQNNEMAIDFIAVRGGIHDWAIYYMPAGQWPIDRILNNGEKMHDRESIKMCVPCDDEAMKFYRD